MKVFHCLFLFIFSFILKATFVFLIALPEKEFIVNDAAGYLDFADTLIQHHAFGVSGDGGIVYAIHRTPLYPLFVAGIKMVWDSLTAVFLCQAVLSALTVVMVYLLAAQIASRWAAFTASFIYLFDVATNYHVCLLLTETLFTFLLLLSVYALVRYLQNGSSGWLCGSAFLFSLVVLTRPIALYMPIVLLPFFFRKREAFIWILIFILPVLGWTARNYLVTGQACYCSISSHNLYAYRSAGTVSALTGIPFEEVREQMSLEAIGKSGKWKTKRAIHIILSHPLAFLQSAAAGMAYIFYGLSADDFAVHIGIPKVEKILSLLELDIVQIFVLCTSLLLCLFFWDLRKIHFLLFGILFYLILISAGPEAGARFRIPILPFCVVLTAAFWDGLFFYCRDFKEF